MDAIVPLLTPALLVGLFAWLRRDMGALEKRLTDRTEKIEKQVSELAQDVAKRFDQVNQRFDQVNRELADQRERMAKLEGSLEGFLAGRRDRDVA